MGQADELLNSLTEGSDSPLLRLANPETEPHIVIGDDRFITVPKELQRIAVQYDHDVETVTFDCPRYWDGLDMSTLNIYINYRRKDRVVGSYKAQDVTVDSTDSNIMHFDWTISRNVTQVNGGLIFLVCIKKGDEDGNEVNHWNSELNTEMYISEGLETGETVVSPYPDLILQWEDEVQAVKDILLAARDSGELDGATFTPSVDGDGNLSWTNDKGRENPKTVNIKGYSPAILVREIEGGKELIITDIRQSQTVTIMDGVDGTSPTMTAEEIEGGVRLTVTDVNGTQSVDVMNGTDGTDGYSPVILVREIEGGKQLIITDQKQSQTVTIMDGVDGKDGTDAVSPTVTITEITGGHQVSITDVNGEKTFNVLNGTDGTDGNDGVSPTVAITDINDGHRVSITDVTGTHTFDVMDGTQDISEAVLNYMNSYVYIGETEPTSGPVLWFDTSARSVG